MYIVLEPLLGKGVHVYLDDILVVAETFGEHQELLTKTLQCLAAHGLRLNPAKCSFGMSNITYLGYNIGRDELKPGEDHILNFTWNTVRI